MKHHLIAATYALSAIGIFSLVDVVRRSNLTFEPKILVMLVIAAVAGHLIGKAGRKLLR